MSYLIFAWIGVFAYGVETIVVKLSSKYAIKNPWLFNFLWNFLFVIFMIPFYITQPVTIPAQWTSLLIASALSAVCCVFFMILTYRLDVSLLGPLYNVKAGLTVFFAWLILGETMTSYQSILIAIIILLGFAVTIDEKTTLKSFFRRDIMLAMVFMVLLSLYVIFLKKTMVDIGMWNATVWIAVLTLVFLLPTYPKFAKDIKTLTKKQILPVIFVTMTSTAAYVLSNKAYEQNVSITTAIMTFPSTLVLAFILAMIWPKLLERHSMKIYALRFLATGIMFWCALQLG
jgi:drug/metabolite transporter (DMT)-like permease